MNISNAVASKRMMPAAILRPRAPGQSMNDAHAEVAGRAPITQAVARPRVKPMAILRPSARPARNEVLPN
jgi:hypothetical protein